MNKGLLGRSFNSPGEVSEMGSAKMATPPSFKENLEYKKQKLELELKNVNEAIEALESHPEVLIVLEKLSKLGY